MANTADKRLEELRRRLGSPISPEVITQGVFEAGPEHLERLARLRPDEQADQRDLCDYMDDLQYRTDIQLALFLYLLPFCLERWDQHIRNENFEWPGFREQFYTVLGKIILLSECLSAGQLAAVHEFMRESILEEIDAQDRLHFFGYPAQPYRWISALTTYGVIAPDVERIWNEWWSIRTQGQAVAAVQYISCLLYPKDENPVFAPYTREKGGGPPCLWEFDGYLFESCWREPNVEFLQSLLGDTRNVIDVLKRAVDRLREHREFAIAKKVRHDVPQCAERLVERGKALPAILATVAQADMYLWPES
jgi:hypothetical protein